ncbi:hypothetical protein LMOIWNZ_00090 [Enterococcus phage vB_OCPT_CCS3]|nr:hypothetical protein LMOIWNZ_00090 [Enterococcus phage vB_OCPT_CCS3]
MEGIELDNYYNFIVSNYLGNDREYIENSIEDLFDILDSKIENITESEFEAAVEGVNEAIENLTNSLSELSEVFTDAKRCLAKEDKKWEENV